MAREPGDRFASAGALAAALRAGAAPPPPPATAETIAMPVRATQATTALPPIAPRRSRAPYAWLAVIAALVVLGVAVLMLARDGGGGTGSAGQTTVTQTTATQPAATQPTAPPTTLIGVDLDAALRELEKRVAELQRSARGRTIDVKLRRFEPVQQVTARLELSGPGRLRAGVDVRGDGSLESWTGTLRRRLIEQRRRESAVDALRRAVAPPNERP
jgi:hypothetical protein